MSLVNKVAIVTGASSGIGAAIAVKFTEEGARVAIVGRNEANLKTTSDLCETKGFKPLTIIADVTFDDDAQNIVAKTLSKFGRIDILINNAGFGKPVNIFDKNVMSLFDQQYLTNFRSAVYLTNLAAEHLCATKGNIVNIGSSSSRMVVSNNLFAYATSKACLEHFTKCVAKEFADYGVRVNMVCPGIVKTKIFDNEAQPVDWDYFRSILPLKKTVEPEEIADLLVFIVSDKGRSITGSSIDIDSGLLLANTFAS